MRDLIFDYMSLGYTQEEAYEKAKQVALDLQNVNSDIQTEEKEETDG